MSYNTSFNYVTHILTITEVGFYRLAVTINGNFTDFIVRTEDSTGITDLPIITSTAGQDSRTVYLVIAINENPTQFTLLGTTTTQTLNYVAIQLVKVADLDLP